MSRYDHKIEISLEGIEHLSKEKKEEKERKMKEKNHYYLRDTKLERKLILRNALERHIIYERKVKLILIFVRLLLIPSGA